MAEDSDPAVRPLLLLLVVGCPDENATVPDVARKPLDEVVICI